MIDFEGFYLIKWTYSIDGIKGNGDLDNFVASIKNFKY